LGRRECKNTPCQTHGSHGVGRKGDTGVKLCVNGRF
jgi:hypothetical protein